MIRITSFPPLPELAPYVYFMWTAETSNSVDVPPIILPPSGYVLLTLFLDDSRYHVRLGGKAFELVPRCSFQGQHYGPVETKSSFAKTKTLGIMFKATAVHRLWGIPMTKLTQKITDAETVLGPKLTKLVDRLQQDEPNLTRLYQVNDFLQDAIAHQPAAEIHMEKVVSMMQEQKGIMPVREIAAHFQYTLRFLERRFKDEVGISPKYLNRVIQFNNMLSVLKYSPEIRWADLAQQSGYFDQAHLIKAFIEFTGRSPVQYEETDNRYTQTHLAKNADNETLEHF